MFTISKIRWRDNVLNDLKKLKVKNWKFTVKERKRNQK
jgi:hypothetical protein